LPGCGAEPCGRPSWCGAKALRKTAGVRGGALRKTVVVWGGALRKRRYARKSDAVRAISVSEGSSRAAIFLTTAPHFSHLYTITNPFFGSGSAFTGTSTPRHGLLRSPGTTSTWSEARQNGQ